MYRTVYKHMAIGGGVFNIILLMTFLFKDKHLNNNKTSILVLGNLLLVQIRSKHIFAEKIFLPWIRTSN